MTRDRLKRIYDLHSWTGIISGLFIYIVCFSGVIALFGNEFISWADKTQRFQIPSQQVSVDRLLYGELNKYSDKGKVTSLYFMYPEPVYPSYRAFIKLRKTDKTGSIQLEPRWNAATGERIADHGSGLPRWFIQFHHRLMLPAAVGYSIVGFMGVLMMLSILSGILSHRKIIRELFTWRLYRSVRLKWQDSHKALGIWGLPFHLMVAITGAFLGLVVVLQPLTGTLAFKGDQKAARIAVTGSQLPSLSGIAAKMYSLDLARTKVRVDAGSDPLFVEIAHWGDKNARYVFHFKETGKLVFYSKIIVNGANGAILEKTLTDRPGISSRIIAAIGPLHYGTYGGMWIKLLYAVLGLGLCVMIATGMMMWLERRIHGHAGIEKNMVAYTLLGRLVVGVTTGIALASIAIFYSDKLISVEPANRSFWIGTVYFSAWLLAIIYSLWRTNNYRTIKEILGLTAIGLVQLPVLNVIVTGEPFVNPPPTGNYYTYGVDIIAALLGISLLLVLSLLPDQRPIPSHKKPF